MLLSCCFTGVCKILQLLKVQPGLMCTSVVIFGGLVFFCLVVFFLNGSIIYMIIDFFFFSQGEQLNVYSFILNVMIIFCF